MNHEICDLPPHQFCPQLQLKQKGKLGDKNADRFGVVLSHNPHVEDDVSASRMLSMYQTTNQAVREQQL